MMGLWSGLSNLTRALAVFVLLSACVGSYTKLRLRPLQKDLKSELHTESGLLQEVRETRATLNRLEHEAELAQRWSDYAQILEEQSTGRSLQEILSTCGTESRPGTSVESARFERRGRAGGFGTVGVDLRMRGSYDDLIDLLGDLDRSFPPIEITRARLRRSEEHEGEAATGGILASLKGVIHEPH